MGFIGAEVFTPPSPPVKVGLSIWTKKGGGWGLAKKLINTFAELGKL